MFSLFYCIATCIQVSASCLPKSICNVYEHSESPVSTRSFVLILADRIYLRRLRIHLVLAELCKVKSAYKTCKSPSSLHRVGTPQGYMVSPFLSRHSRPETTFTWASYVFLCDSPIIISGSLTKTGRSSRATLTGGLGVPPNASPAGGVRLQILT